MSVEEMSVEEFMEAIVDYFGAFERPGIRLVVARYVSELEAEVRRSLYAVLLTSMTTQWGRAPDLHDVMQVVDKAEVAAATPLDAELAWWWS